MTDARVDFSLRQAEPLRIHVPARPSTLEQRLSREAENPVIGTMMVAGTLVLAGVGLTGFYLLTVLW